MQQVIEMKMKCSIGGWPGLVAIVAIAAACLAWGWAPTVRCLSSASAWRIAATAAALLVAGIVSGMFLLGPQELRHEIVRHWAFRDYAVALASNVLWTFVVTGATVAVFLRLDVFSSKGRARRLTFGFGVCCVAYLLASLVYILLMPQIQE